MRRQYINQEVSIDGRQIPYPIFNAYGYLLEKENMSEEDIEKWSKENVGAYTILNQILALKQSCFLLRHTSDSCGSLGEALYDLKDELIQKFNCLYELTFDEAWVESQI